MSLGRLTGSNIGLAFPIYRWTPWIGLPGRIPAGTGDHETRCRACLVRQETSGDRTRRACSVATPSTLDSPATSGSGRFVGYLWSAPLTLEAGSRRARPTRSGYPLAPHPLFAHRRFPHCRAGQRSARRAVAEMHCRRTIIGGGRPLIEAEGSAVRPRRRQGVAQCGPGRPGRTSFTVPTPDLFDANENEGVLRWSQNWL